MLKRKQNSLNTEWVEAWRSIDETPVFTEVDALVSEAVTRIEAIARRFTPAAYAWSGGKDSLVLGRLCEMAGVNQAVFVTARRLDYPVFLDWVEANAPAHCELVDIPLGLDYLRRHPELLFPSRRMLPRWYAMIQHKGQRQFYRERGLGVLFVGRRKADGNCIRGSADDGFMMIRSDGQRISAPIADWSHEHILAFLRKHSVPLPPIYGFPDGWRQGTHLWCCRLSLGSEQANWQELYSFAPEVVRYAVHGLPGAMHYLEQLGDKI